MRMLSLLQGGSTSQLLHCHNAEHEDMGMMVDLDIA
ncbi:multicopper oxidase domain-containing protein [Streptomyces sp. NBC_00118]